MFSHFNLVGFITEWQACLGSSREQVAQERSKDSSSLDPLAQVPKVIDLEVFISSQGQFLYIPEKSSVFLSPEFKREGSDSCSI